MLVFENNAVTDRTIWHNKYYDHENIKMKLMRGKVVKILTACLQECFQCSCQSFPRYNSNYKKLTWWFWSMGIVICSSKFYDAFHIQPTETKLYI